MAYSSCTVALCNLPSGSSPTCACTNAGISRRRALDTSSCSPKIRAAEFDDNMQRSDHFAAHRINVHRSCAYSTAKGLQYRHATDGPESAQQRKQKQTARSANVWTLARYIAKIQVQSSQVRICHSSCGNFSVPGQQQTCNFPWSLQDIDIIGCIQRDYTDCELLAFTANRNNTHQIHRQTLLFSTT